MSAYEAKDGALYLVTDGQTSSYPLYEILEEFENGYLVAMYKVGADIAAINFGNLTYIRKAAVR